MDDLLYVRNRGFLIPSHIVCLLLIVISEDCELSFPIYHNESLVDFAKIFNKRKVKYGCTQICFRKFAFHSSHLKVYLKPRVNSEFEYRAYTHSVPKCYEVKTFALILQKFPSGVPRSPISLELLCRIQMLLVGYVKKNKWSKNVIEKGAIPLVPQFPDITRVMCRKAFFPRVRPMFWLNRRYMLDSTCSRACKPGALYHTIYHSCSTAWPGMITESCGLTECPFYSYNSDSDDDLPSPSGEPYF